MRYFLVFLIKTVLNSAFLGIVCNHKQKTAAQYYRLVRRRTGAHVNSAQVKIQYNSSHGEMFNIPIHSIQIISQTSNGYENNCLTSIIFMIRQLQLIIKRFLTLLL